LRRFFDFDAQEGEGPEPPDCEEGPQAIQVRDEIRADGDDALACCFRFRYERSWSEYYKKAGLTEAVRSALWRHTLGTIAVIFRCFWRLCCCSRLEAACHIARAITSD
jgi:hypothetical protein